MNFRNQGVVTPQVLTELLPFLWLPGYYKIGGSPVFAQYNIYEESSPGYIKTLALALDKQGYDTFYCLLYNDSNLRLQQYTSAEAIRSRFDFRETALLEVCNSSGEVSMAVGNLKVRVDRLLDGWKPGREQLEYMLELLDAKRSQERDLQEARNALTVFKQQVVQLQSGSDAESLQKHYNRVYEEMPLWYRQVGALVRKLKNIFGANEN